MDQLHKIKVVIAVLLLIGISSCQRPLEEQDLIFIGSWSSEKFYLEIGANGYGFCQRRNRTAIEGRVRITDDCIIFNGSESGGRRRFRIDTRPSVDLGSGEVFMILDNKDFLKH